MAKKSASIDENHAVLIAVLWDGLLQIGYEPIAARQKAKDVIRLGLQAPRPIEGSELGFQYTNNTHRCVVWTSWLPELQLFRTTGTDIFWSIITQNDELVYCAKPIPRIDIDSIVTLLRYAMVSKWKVDNLPLCDFGDCKARVEIYRKRGTRQYMYVCKKKKNHVTKEHPNGVWNFMSWDYALPPKAKKFLMTRREASALYRKKCEALGVEPVPKAVKRKRWKMTKPQNRIAKNT